jgi:hypothetical protein
MNDPRARPDVAAVDPMAATFLDVVVDAGHLDEPLLAEVNDRLLDLAQQREVLGLDDVRRVVAEVLFEHMAELDPEARRVLETEWPLLFY